MNHSDDELRQATALFRYGVVADLVHLPVGTPGLIARMRDKAAQTYAIPGTTRTRVAANTIRDWIKLYRDGGFEALYPKPRADRGQPRRMPPEVATRLIALKLANPTWSVRTVIRDARDAGIDYEDTPAEAPTGAHDTGYRETTGEENRGGIDDVAARQSAGSSTHLELEKITLLTAGKASRRGTRLSSKPHLITTQAKRNLSSRSGIGGVRSAT